MTTNPLDEYRRRWRDAADRLIEGAGTIDQATALKPEAVTFAEAMAGKHDMRLTVLACADNFTLSLGDPHDYQHRHGHVVSYQSWNDRWSELRGVEIGLDEVDEYLTAYRRHAGTYADDIYLYFQQGR